MRNALSVSRWARHTLSTDLLSTNLLGASNCDPQSTDLLSTNLLGHQRCHTVLLSTNLLGAGSAGPSSFYQLARRRQRLSLKLEPRAMMKRWSRSRQRGKSHACHMQESAQPRTPRQACLLLSPLLLPPFTSSSPRISYHLSPPALFGSYIAHSSPFCAPSSSSVASVCARSD